MTSDDIGGDDKSGGGDDTRKRRSTDVGRQPRRTTTGVHQESMPLWAKFALQTRLTDQKSWTSSSAHERAQLPQYGSRCLHRGSSLIVLSSRPHMQGKETPSWRSSSGPGNAESQNLVEALRRRAFQNAEVREELKASKKKSDRISQLLKKYIPVMPENEVVALTKRLKKTAPWHALVVHRGGHRAR